MEISCSNPAAKILNKKGSEESEEGNAKQVHLRAQKGEGRAGTAFKFFRRALRFCFVLFCFLFEPFFLFFSFFKIIF